MLGGGGGRTGNGQRRLAAGASRQPELIDGQTLAAVYCHLSYADIADAVLRLQQATKLTSATIALLPRCSLPREPAVWGTCTICQQKMRGLEVVFSLNCGHAHHRTCLGPWLKRKASCPDCRASVEPPRGPPCGDAGHGGSIWRHQVVPDDMRPQGLSGWAVAVALRQYGRTLWEDFFPVASQWNIHPYPDRTFPLLAMHCHSELGTSAPPAQHSRPPTCELLLCRTAAVGAWCCLPGTQAR